MTGQPLVFNIQRYSVHDGNGIRTSIFFKGCPLSCLWCHNPESQSFQPELLLFHDRCTACGACEKHCRNHAISFTHEHDHECKLELDRSKCTACGDCVDWCLQNAREVAGKAYTVKELVHEAEKDRAFYEQSGGGITLSGGEVMVQDTRYITQLCRVLFNKGYSVNIDTCGHAPYENFTSILPYIDTFLYDLKLMSPELHKKFVGVDNALVLENLTRLSHDGAKINIRVPVIGGVNDDESFFSEIIKFLRENTISVTQVNLLPYHDTGRHKYGKLDRDYAASFSKPEQGRMDSFRDIFIDHGFTNTKIGG